MVRKIGYYLIDLLAMIIFYFAFIYEGAKDNRYVLLLTLFVAYVILSIVKNIFKEHSKIILVILCLKILLLLFIEINSKFAINYFIHAVYLLIIIESTSLLSFKSSLIINSLAFIISLYKFFNLISFNNSISNISQMFLFVLINSLVIIILGFAKYHQEEKSKIDNIYKELLSAHYKLKDYAQKIKELTTTQERNRIARDLHDTLGHNMTGLIMQMEMTSSMMDKDMDEAKVLMEESKITARESLKKVREIVETFKDESRMYTDIGAIKELIEEFSNKTGVNIYFEVNGEKIALSPDVYITLYRVIQESMTNAVRHGKADEMKIVIKYEKDVIRFSITDNGVGCDDVCEGYGLKGMRERVSLLGGFIEYRNEYGFEVMGEINRG
ncbi:sensor histidine kinase [Vallitalea sp.]|uniref:sensor histidine kinase n=1 Tax=Vallitalea sp. TaxID=1882829 RepID=UPI0025E750A6|nr:sensor histidine kinase [Vallitalea sp.]MCT4688786.1 sensor histidine kinase [Vallitalea sp.]